MQTLKVALVHDYLKEYGGAERVVEALHELYPDSPLYTAYFSPRSLGIHAIKFRGWKIHTSFLQRIPFAGTLISPFRIFAPIIFENSDLRGYDVVISSSAIYFAKAVITSPKTLHLGYIHTPPRYLYGFTTTFNYKKNPLTRLAAEIANHFLRLWDFEVSRRPDILIANSENVKKRIAKFYRRDCVVIHPPVEVEQIIKTSRQIANPTRDYYIAITRLWGGKGLDLIIDCFNQNKLPLKIIGTGPLFNSLKAKSKSNIQFLGSLSDEEKIHLLTNAKALIAAAEDEDFGITVVESQAAGTPVIALRQGGYQETIVDKKTGVFFDSPSSKSLQEAIESFGKLSLDPQACRTQSAKFSKKVFQDNIRSLVKQNTPSS